MDEVLLSLGSNLGSRRRNLRRAVTALKSGVTISAVSPVYETPPWGKMDQPNFLNLCVRGTTQLAPKELLEFVKAIETRLGRASGEKWGPRLIDIDILAYGELTLRTQSLNIPHKEIEERAFVLVPLNDIAPDWRHPITHCSVADMLASVDRSEIVLLSTELEEN